MTIVCAKCGQSIEEDLPGDGTSHGLCKSCSIHFLAQVGVSIDEYLNSISVPTLLLDSNGDVAIANSAALSWLGKSAPEISKKPGGEVFECEHALLPEGCGHTKHCSGCVIRNSIEETMQTGLPRLRVPAILQRADTNAQTIYISTRKCGGVVFLRIDRSS